MKKASRAAVVDGADLSLGAFLLMPVFAASLSVTMWLELPTFGEALQSRGALIREHRTVVERLAATVPTEPVRRSSCTAPLSPPPHFDEDDPAITNVAIFSPDDLTAAHLPRRLNGDQELYLRGQTKYLVGWIDDPPSTSGRRMSRARIAAEIEHPIRNNRYVLFYGTTSLTPTPEAATATRVDAFLYDVTTGDRVCELGLVSNGGLVETGQQLVAALHESARPSATERPRAY